MSAQTRTDPVIIDVSNHFLGKWGVGCCFSCPVLGMDCRWKRIHTSEAEAHVVQHSVEGDREYDTTQGCASHHDTQSQALSRVEVMSYYRKRGAEHQTQADATQDRLGEEKLVVFVAKASENQRDHVNKRRRNHDLGSKPSQFIFLRNSLNYSNGRGKEEEEKKTYDIAVSVENRSPN